MSLFKNIISAVAGSKFDQPLDLLYITERLLMMGFPENSSEPKMASRNVDLLSAYLHKHHNQHFMVFNLSEKQYDYSKFGNQVVEYFFPDHHAPPLEMLFKICYSIDSWLKENDKNVAVVHCLPGKGRTGTVISAYLTYDRHFDHGLEALSHYNSKVTGKEKVTPVPSQRRYVEYFSEVLMGSQLPNTKALKMVRIIMNTIPAFSQEGGCRPYLQIYDSYNRKLLYSNKKAGVDPKHYFQSDGSISIPVDIRVRGDVLLKCFHVTSRNTRVPMFRFSFHTGFIPLGVLRLPRSKLDCACRDPRFDSEMFLDIIFMECDDVVKEEEAAAEEENVIIRQVLDSRNVFRKDSVKGVHLPRSQSMDSQEPALPLATTEPSKAAVSSASTAKDANANSKTKEGFTSPSKKAAAVPAGMDATAAAMFAKYDYDEETGSEASAMNTPRKLSDASPPKGSPHIAAASPAQASAIPAVAEDTTTTFDNKAAPAPAPESAPKEVPPSVTSSSQQPADVNVTEEKEAPRKNSLEDFLDTLDTPKTPADASEVQKAMKELKEASASSDALQQQIDDLLGGDDLLTTGDGAGINLDDFDEDWLASTSVDYETMNVDKDSLAKALDDLGL